MTQRTLFKHYCRIEEEEEKKRVKIISFFW